MADFRVADVYTLSNELPADASYDVVVQDRVGQHLVRPLEAIKEVGPLHAVLSAFVFPSATDGRCFGERGSHLSPCPCPCLCLSGRPTRPTTPTNQINQINPANPTNPTSQPTYKPTYQPTSNQPTNISTTDLFTHQPRWCK